MRRPDLRIRVQLTVSVCLFTLVCLVSLAVAIYTLSRNTLIRLERGNLDLNSRMLREECRQEFEDVYDSFYRLSYSNPVQRIFENSTSSQTVLDAANLLHNSFGPDRILLMILYLSNGTEILEVDSRSFANRTDLPHTLLPITYAGSSMKNVLSSLDQGNGEFVGPEKSVEAITGTNYFMSLTLPIRVDERRSYTQTNVTNGTLGYATFLINCLKLQSILSSVSLSSAANEVGTAALCSAVNNYTEFQQLIPFNDNATSLGGYDTSQYFRKYKATLSRRSTNSFGSIKQSDEFTSDGNFGIPETMADNLRHDLQPVAQVNKGPNKSMISISQFGILNSEYYIVVLQSHKGVYYMTHHLRNIIVLSSCVIGAGMIIFTFLFVSFGARQILRLKMAATYEQPAPTKWKFLPLPWWLRPVNRKQTSGGSDKSEFRVPEKVPLRKHVRDELDDITERFNIMSNELRKQYALLEDRVEVRKAEIEQAREAADIANAAKSHFLARVTHELRTPLNGIIGTASMCLEDDDIASTHQSLRTIFKCGELLLNLMTDLLSFSQNEQEQLTLEPRDFCLSEITSQLTAIFTEQCAGKHIRLVVDSDPENNKYIFNGDTNRILQVIFNLMSNGIKFTPEGGEVYFRVKIADNHKDPTWKNLTFYVRDNGPGIAPEMQVRVFEAFVQGDISSHVKKAGVGLGLSICRQLAELMKGTVLLKSELGKGSMFIFKIPLKYHLYDSDSTSGSGQDALDISSTASILRTSQGRNGTNYSTPLGTPLEKTDENDWTTGQSHVQQQGSPSSTTSSPGLQDKSPESGKASTARSKLTRTLSSTSQRTKGFLTSRRKTQDSSSFRPMDLLKRRASSDTENSKQLLQPSNDSDNTEQSPKSQRIAAKRTASQGIVPRLPTLPQNEIQQDKRGSRGSSPSSMVSPTPGNHNDEKFSSTKPLESGAAVGITGQKNVPTQNNNSGVPIIKMPTPRNEWDTSTPSPTVLPDSHNIGVDTAPRPRITSNKSSTEKPPPDLKVLVVDDNSVNQEVMMRMLNLEGLHDIIVANDGLDALEKIKQADAEHSSFDVIFMDVQMPNMDGRQATRVIRKEMENHVPVVAVSAFANETNADDCIDAGMNLFLSKPLRRPHLREILRSLSEITAMSQPTENGSKSSGEKSTSSPDNA